MTRSDAPESGIRKKVYDVIFGTETPAGRFFDVVLLIAILLSVLTIMLESVKELDQKYWRLFDILEWVFTGLFTVEYLLRVWSTSKPKKYIFSTFGIIDLLSTIPTYLGLFFIGAHSLMVLRTIRLIRVFRILKLARFLGEASQLTGALRASRHKISVFLVAVVIIVVIMGTIMYIVEGGENGFTSIPRCIYWAVVTLTTVGYGDIAPATVAGQAIAAFIMIMGYGIIAVPTGIVTSEMASKSAKQSEGPTKIKCGNCGKAGHDEDATFCKHCGSSL